MNRIVFALIAAFSMLFAPSRAPTRLRKRPAVAYLFARLFTPRRIAWAMYQAQAQDTDEPVSDSVWEIVANQRLYSVISGCAVTYDAADLTIDVAAGWILHDGNLVQVSQQLNVDTLVPDGSNPLWCWIKVNGSGTASAVEGTAAADPAVEEIGDFTTLALVKIVNGDTIANDIAVKLDKRIPGPISTRTVYVPAFSMASPGTNGAADGITDGTNLIYRTKDYDQTTEEHADFHFRMPDKYFGGNITWRALWTASAGAGTVAWEINLLAVANDGVIDAAKTDIGSITDTLIATGDLHEASLAQSSNLPAASDTMLMRVSRDVAADTLTGDAKLITLIAEFDEAAF